MFVIQDCVDPYFLPSPIWMRLPNEMRTEKAPEGRKCIWGFPHLLKNLFMKIYLFVSTDTYVKPQMSLQRPVHILNAHFYLIIFLKILPSIYILEKYDFFSLSMGPHILYAFNWDILLQYIYIYIFRWKWIDCPYILNMISFGYYLKFYDITMYHFVNCWQWLTFLQYMLISN